ncbi:hypothetical protein BH20ACI2_BH20ACI2_29200 [soil metagenome]
MTVLEGTWEEIQKFGSRLIGRRFRLTVLDDDLTDGKTEPNKKMLSILKDSKKKQAKMRFTDGSKTQQLLREGRSGGMFGE